MKSSFFGPQTTNKINASFLKGGLVHTEGLGDKFLGVVVGFENGPSWEHGMQEIRSRP